MKKYLMTGIAALAIGAAFVSCSHEIEQLSQEELNNIEVQKIKGNYEQAFIKTFGQPASNQDWGFGTTSVAGVRGETRAVPGITFPDAFSEKTNISEPGTIQKPTINKSDANIVYTESQTVQSIDGDKTIYVESGVTLTIDNSYGVSLERVNIYLASGSSLVVPNSNFYLKGNSNMVNDGGTIIVGDENNKKDIVFENFTGTFWNNGTINYVNDFKTYNGEGGNIYLGSSSVLNATNLYLFKKVLLRNEGEITLTGEFNADQYEHKIYNSGTITTPKIILQKKTVLWNEGTITAANGKEIESSSINNENVQIYNGTYATLKLEIMTLTNNSELVINDGILNVKGKITTQNNSEIVNYNKLTGGEFEMMSGSRFYNVAGGEVTITGLSKISNDGSGSNKDNVWMNSGKYTTGSFEATGGCQNPAAFNNCHMYVTGQFFMNHSNFVLDGGGAVECGSFKWEDDNYFHMGGKALLKVTGQLLANNNDTGYGFYGDGTDYAVIQAGSIEKGSEGKFRAAYFGNLFIDTNSHFTQGENSADGTWYTFGDNVKFSFTDNTDVSGFQTHGAKTAKKAENFSITIPADPNGCTPGYKYNPPVTSTGSIRIIAEDLSAGEDDDDFDFNDVVIDVYYGDQGQAKAKILAAGGTLQLKVDGKEVHEEFSKANNNIDCAGKMINTNGTNSADANVRSKSLDGLTAPVITLSKEVKTPIQARDNIKIEVFKNNQWIELEAAIGKVASKVRVGTDYVWKDERSYVGDGFKAFVAGTASYDEWYQNNQ